MYINVQVTKQTGTDEEPIFTAVEGYHIDSIIDHPELAEYKVVPNSPQHKFAGAETYHYRFADEQEARELLPQAFPENVQDEDAK